MTTRITQLSQQVINMVSRPDIHLYTTQTPNGIKISITLEELGLPYKVTKIDISKNTQKEPWFLEINPNGRIPALTDTFTDGKTIRLFESGSIQQYLVDQYDKDYKISYPRGTREFYEMNNWASHTNNFGVNLKLILPSFSSSMPA
jgi:glutathione S-transferase